MAARILHVSDLHLGVRPMLAVEGPLGDFVDERQPDLIVASGDLSNRGRRGQHEAAAEFLRALGAPVLAVPGNHDLPYTPIARFTRPFDEFERIWQTTTPAFESDELVVVGLNSARNWRHQSGKVPSEQLSRAIKPFERAPEGAARVAVLHHHFLSAPWRSRKRPLSGRARTLDVLADAGVDLILGGHIHQTTVYERSDFQAADEHPHRLVLATAPGLTRPRPRRLGESRGFNFYEFGDDDLVVRTFVWSGTSWVERSERRFPH